LPILTEGILPPVEVIKLAFLTAPDLTYASVAGVIVL
jgi:hypothetical protein